MPEERLRTPHPPSMPDEHPTVEELSSEVIDRLTEKGGTVAVAESVSGGGLADALTGVAGSSRAFVLGVVAYSGRAKTEVLDCDPAGLESHGQVSAWTAAAMAEGVRRLAGSTWGVATTGVAGPDPLEGAVPGTVHVAVSREGAGRVVTGALEMAGDREGVKAGAVKKALAMLLEALSP